jgi:four helix bundle protein
VAIRSYEDPEVWQEAMNLVEVVYSISSKFPDDERFGLTSQVRRASISIASNIAEGHAQTSARDFMRFLSMAMGSLAELHTQMLIVKRMRFISDDAVETATLQIASVGRLLHGLMKSINARLSQPQATSR